MKVCPNCNALHAAAENCDQCGYRPEVIDGFEAYAPDLAHGGGGFKAGYFSELAAIEAGHFWFRARNDLLLWALQKYGSGIRSFLEIGCGTGYVLAGIAKALPAIQLCGSEIFTAGLAYAAQRLPDVRFLQMDARCLPYREEFDAIGAFDVLEHIDEDTEVLSQIGLALKPAGLLFVTVPQHPWLWSRADEDACHVRRYSGEEIQAKIVAAGFELDFSTSFVSLLLPAMYLSRNQRTATQQSGEPQPSATEFQLPRTLNSVFYRIMQAEFGSIRAGLRLPVGGSRMVVARKRADKNQHR